jgi:hypothetical protein
MEIETVVYEFVDSTLLPGWVMRVVITGTNIQQRATPILAVVGSQPVLGMMPLIGEQRGVFGFLASEPEAGDELRIGYADEELINTGFLYDPNIA